MGNHDICHGCHGYGARQYTCRDCNGTRVNLSGAKCVRCNGTGVVETRCKRCNGTGHHR